MSTIRSMARLGTPAEVKIGVRGHVSTTCCPSPWGRGDRTSDIQQDVQKANRASQVKTCLSWAWFPAPVLCFRLLLLQRLQCGWRSNLQLQATETTTMKYLLATCLSFGLLVPSCSSSEFDVDWSKDISVWLRQDIAQHSVALPPELLPGVAYSEQLYRFPIEGEIRRGGFAVYKSIQIVVGRDATISADKQLRSFKKLLQDSRGLLLGKEPGELGYEYLLPRSHETVRGEKSFLSSEYGFFIPSNSAVSLRIGLEALHDGLPRDQLQPATIFRKAEMELLGQIVKSLKRGSSESDHNK